MPKCAKIKNICVYLQTNKYTGKFICMQMGTKDKEREGREGRVTSVKLFNIPWVFYGVFPTLIIVCYM